LHELATNAAKYGALSADQGCVEVSWRHDASRPLVINWVETGGPPCQAPVCAGFGSVVIERMIGQVRGNVTRDWRTEGLACELTIPL
jgi:two-component sensor histidine kinase